MVRIAIDGVQQMPGGASADFLQIVVERGDRHAAFGGGDLPIVMTDNRDILWHTYTLGEQCLDDSACKHVVEAKYRIGNPNRIRLRPIQQSRRLLGDM